MGDDAKPGGPARPALRLDHVREVSTASTMSSSSPGTPADEPPSSSLDKEEDGAKLSKSQRRKLREKAKKQSQNQKGEKNSPRPSSKATPNSVDNSAVQEPKPVATIPVDVPVGEGEGVLVDAKTESGEDDAPVIVEKPDATASTAETGTDELDDEWGW